MAGSRPAQDGEYLSATRVARRGRARRIWRVVNSQRVRLAVFWVAVIAGGGLQYAYSETIHPSVALKIWARVSAVVVVILIATVLGYAIRALRQRQMQKRD